MQQWIRKFDRKNINRAARHIIDTVMLIWECAAGWFILALVLVVAQAILPLAALYISKLVFDSVTVAFGTADPIAIDAAVIGPEITRYVVLLGVLLLLNNLATLALDFVFDILSQLVTDHIYHLLHTKAASIDLAFFENPDYFNMLYRAQDEVEYRPAQLIEALISMLKNGISMVGIAVLLVSLYSQLIVILVVASLPGFVARLWYAIRQYRWKRRVAPIERRSWYFNDMLTGRANAKENRLFGLGAHFTEQSDGLRSSLRGQRIRMASQYYFAELLAQVSATGALIFAFVIMIQRALAGLLTVGDLVMYYTGFQNGQAYLRGFLGGLAKLYENSLFLSNLYELLALEPKLVDSAAPRFLPQPIKQGIRFDDVSFAYGPGLPNVLHNIDLTIKPGEVIALVGENGSGKTTLVKLLCRLYDATSGTISIDGTPIQNIKLANLRENYSVIFQDFVQYYLTARENIWFGNINLPQDSEQISLAAQKAGVDEMITQMRNGYDTLLGKWLEDGEEASGGNWQKIALARAFLRDSQIIILDEPTSAIDAIAEEALFKKIRELTAGKTVILISHRLSSVKMADTIHVLDQGRIIESGPHEALMAHNGQYARMFNAQAQYYITSVAN
ncbi:ABC transporter ATP-binding protein [Phototrophicus methaneseepsis]|uniref:ABC transporter ATP-binding protein n=1 Tax=Phototrophicus methaneseepsis TaxID=2710758 RepID=A0A7S8EDL8_9CHLR|nr:ABC transporter ATP-binding protein [Phototrophicus methaneseepsis]QPC85007.1 ABC transporter ATP-binding protein [Phototrophicus methaneseepsis]